METSQIPLLVAVVLTIVPIAFAMFFPLLLAGPLTWAERRQSAMMQDRVGPNRAALVIGGKEIRAFGLLHPLADVIKLITKEDTINHSVDRFLYNLAPLISLFPALVTFAIIPFGPDLSRTPRASRSRPSPTGRCPRARASSACRPRASTSASSTCSR